MKKLLALMAIFTFTSAPSFAADSEKEIKIAKIFVAQGLTEQIQAQLDSIKGGQFEQIAKRIFDNSLANHSKSSKISKEKSSEILTRFVKKCSEGLTVEAVLKDAIKVYGEGLAEQDLDFILSYYQSPTGRKDVASTLKVAAIIGISMSQILDDQLAEQIPELLKELDRAVSE